MNLTIINIQNKEDIFGPETRLLPDKKQVFGLFQVESRNMRQSAEND